MKTVVIFETENTDSPLDYAKLYQKFAVCRCNADKKRVLKGFKQPTCTDNAELVAEAIRIESLIS